LKRIYAAPGESVDPLTLTTEIMSVIGADEELVKHELDQLLADLDGDVSTDDKGVIHYLFPRLGEESRAVAKARAAAGETKLGEVVFTSESAD
jgi:hypothetical protein